MSATPQPASKSPVEPTGRPTIFDARSFVFWLFVVALGYSAIQLFNVITGAPGILVNPAIGWLALVVWGFYGIVFLLIVYYHQLFVRRSPWITLFAFLWGGVIAVWFAGKANAALEDIFGHVFSSDFNDGGWGTAIAAASNEESLKLLGVAVIVLLPLTAVRSTLDGWFYGMMVGLGFEVVENYLFTVQQAGSLSDAFSFLIARGLLGGLWSHAIYTGIVGAGIGYLVSRHDRSWARRIGVAVGLFAIAWSVHFFWDSPWLNDWTGGDSVGTAILGIVIKGIPALVVLLLVVRWGRTRERVVWSEFVNGHIDEELVSKQEAEALLDRKGRKAARHQVREAKGHRAGRLQKHLQYAQLRYIQSVSEEGPESVHATKDAADIRELRAAIAHS